jgi:hypothetical protein
MNNKLHAAIMNLPCKFEAAWQTPAPSEWVEGYVNGHRDTRHAAAELVSAAMSARDAEVERLREALEQCFDYPADVFDLPEDARFKMTLTGRHLRMVGAALSKEPK